MATPTGVTALDGNFKQQYPSKIENLVPECALIYKEVPFVQKSLQNGSYYIQPVILSDEQGWTYLAPDSTNYDLGGNVSMATKPAQVLGSQIIGQSQLSYEAAARAERSTQAFEDAVGLQMRVLKTSGVKRLEVNFLYGGTSLSLIASSTNASATTTNIVIKLSEWSAALFSGMTNARLDAYQSNGTTKINSNGVLNITTVNSATRTILVTGIAADITALDAYVLANANVTQLFFAGANGTEAAGFKKQLTNTTTLFNIDAATWDLWKGNTYAVGGVAFTFAKMQAAIALAVNRGLQEEVNVYVNPNTWQNLMTDQAALRMYDSSYSGSEIKNGAEKLTFMSQNGRVNVMSHLFVKEGDAFIIPMGKVGRFGATDITFNIPGSMEGRVFIQVDQKACFEYRCYSNQTIFLEAPAQGVYASGIVN